MPCISDSASYVAYLSKESRTEIYIFVGVCILELINANFWKGRYCLCDPCIGNIPEFMSMAVSMPSCCRS